MATTVKPEDLTPRQSDIVNQSAKLLGVNTSYITNIVIGNADIPESITLYNGPNGALYNTSLKPYYGEVLTPQERSDLLIIRAQNYTSDTSNGTTSLLGQNKKPVMVDSSGRTMRINTSDISTFDPSQSRLQAAGLNQGAVTIAGGTDPNVTVTGSAATEDRVRISDPSGKFISSGSPVLSPLAKLGFVLFPYTPQISLSHNANYDAQALTHSNYEYQFYSNSSVSEINITGTFTAKNSVDAAYVIAVQHFFRSVTKMFYGQDAEAGLPPPVLRLDGHGDYQFKSVPIVIKSFSVNLPNDVDYISTVINSSTSMPGNPANRGPGSNPTAIPNTATSNTLTRVPVLQDITVTCIPVYSRRSISQDFGLNKFAAGQLLNKGFI